MSFEIIAQYVVDGIQPIRVHQSGIAFLKCPHCSLGSVCNGLAGERRQIPAPKAGEGVLHLPQDVSNAWDEARTCLGAGAFTACEIMCRKILTHTAVGVAGATTNDNFVQCVTKLETAHYITPPMKPWVDQIRANGNESAHELTQPAKERAADTLAFTAQLLKIVYEMPGRHQAHQP